MKNMKRKDIFELITKATKEANQQVIFWECQERDTKQKKKQLEQEFYDATECTESIKHNMEMQSIIANKLRSIKELKQQAKGQLLLASRLEKAIKQQGNLDIDDNIYYLFYGMTPAQENLS